MSENEGRLLRLADRISTGQAIDWDAAFAFSDDEHVRRTVSSLAVIARLASTTDISSEAGRGPGSPASSDPPTVPIDTAGERWGHLRILRKLGEGSFGEVFLAEDPTLRKKVALKLARPRHSGDPVRAAAILREGRLLAKLRHPNIVTVYGVDSYDGRLGIWMEYVEGQTLEEILAEKGPFGAPEATLIGVDVCRALSSAHKSGVMHCDIKSNNVMREHGGRIVLMDFGVGCDREREASDSDGGAFGTPSYMAPERLEHADATPASEIYSIGVLLYHLVTGSFPVAGESLGDLITAHREGRSSLLTDVRPDLPESFIHVIETALAHDPADRFATAGELERALREVVGAGDVEHVPPVQRRSRRHLSVVAVVTALVVATAIMVWLQLWPPGAPSTTAYSMQAAMFRSLGRSEERLMPGAEIGIADRLFLEFSATTSVHVYVLNEDERGHAHLLFPIAESDLANPLEPNVFHQLPGTTRGARIFWEVDTFGGTEHFLIVASPERLDAFEALIADLDPAITPDPPVGALDDALTKLLRGVGAVAKGPAGNASARAGLFERVEQLLEGPEEVRGIWTRQIDLRNPD